MTEELLLLFNEPWASWLFGELLLVWGFASWLRLRLKHLRPIQAKLESAIELLNNHPDAAAFADNFVDIDNQLTVNNLLGGRWGSFVKFLQLPPGNEPILSSQDPEQYFLFEPLVKDFFDLHYYRFMPVYLAGSGLLISFSFMIAGLSFVTKEFFVSQPDQAQILLGSFLSGVSFTFFPALVGIFAGVVFAWGRRRQFNRQAKLVAYFCHLLKERINIASVDDLIGLMGAPTPQGADGIAITKALDKIIKHLDSSMGGLQQKTVQEVLAAVQPLGGELRQEFEKLTDQQGESLDELLDNVTALVKTQIATGNEQLLADNNRLEKNSLNLDERVSAMVHSALKPVLDSIKDDIANLSETQEKSLRDSVGGVALHSQQPEAAQQTLELVKQDMDQLMIRQDKVIQEGLTAVTKQLRGLFPTEEIKKLVASSNPEEGDAMATIVERLKGQAFVEPIIDLIQTEGERFSKHNDRIAQELLNDTTKRLHTMIAEQTKLLQQTSERIDISAEKLLKNADKFAAQSLDAMEGALRQEGARLQEKSEKSLRESLGELTSQLRFQVENSTGELLHASKRLNKSASRFEQKTEKEQALAKDSILAAVVAEGNKIREMLAEQPILEHITQALKSQSQELANNQNQALHKALSDVAVRGAEGKIALDPILAAVKAESQQQLAQQGSTIRAALEDVVAGLNRSLAPEKIINAIKTHSDQLSKKQESLSKDIAELGTTLSTEHIVETMESDSRWLKKSQDSLLGVVTGLADSLSPDAIVAAIDSQTKRLLDKQKALSSDIAQLGESLSPDGILADIQNQTANLAEKISAISMEPILAALQSQSERLAQTQSQALHSALSDVAVRNSEGQLSIDPMLAAIKAESERVLTQQGSIIRNALDGMTKKLGQSLAPDSIIATVQEESKRLAVKQEKLSREIAGLNDALDHDALITAVKTESTRISKQQESLNNTINKLAATLDPQHILDAIKSQGATLLHKVSGISMEPILVALQHQGEQLAESQQLALHSALSEVVVKAENGEISVDPILATIKAESQKQLAQQGNTIRKALDGLVANIGNRFNPEKIISSLHDETDRLVKKQEGFSAQIQALKESLSPEEIITAIQAESKRLHTSQNALNDIVSGLGQSLAQEDMIAAMQSQTASLLEKVSGISLQPILEALNSQSQQLAQAQSQTLQSALSDIAIRGSDGDITIDPMLAAIKAASEKQLSQQGTIIREALDGVVNKIANSLNPTTIIDAVQAESQRLHRSQESLHSIVAELNHSIDPHHLIEIIENQGSRLSRKQDSLSKQIVGLNESLAPEQIIAVVAAKTDRIFKQQESISKQIAGFSESLAPERFFAGINAKTSALMEKVSAISIEPILDAIKIQGQQLAQSQSQALHGALSGLAVRGQDGEIAIDPLLAAVKAESEKVLQNQGAIIDAALDGLVIKLNNTLAPESLIATVKEESARLSNRQDNFSEQLTDLGKRLDPAQVIAAIKIESQRLSNDQAALNGIVNGLNESLAPEQIIATVESKSNRLAKQQDALRSQIAGLAHSLAPESIIAQIKSQSATLLQKVEEISLAPILAAIENQNQQLAHNQSQTLHTLLSDIAVRDGSGEISIDPILAAVKADSERVLAQQSTNLRNTFAGVVAKIGQAISGEEIIAQIKSETALLSKNQELLQDSVAALNVSLAPEHFIEAMESKSNQLVKQQDALRNQISNLGETLAPAKIIDAVQHESQRLRENQGALNGIVAELKKSLLPAGVMDTFKNQMEILGQKVGNISLEPIIGALKEQGEQLAQSQSEALHSALSNLAVRDSDGKIAIDPILAAVKAESERVLAQQGKIIGTTLDGVIAQLNSSTITNNAISILENQGELILAKQEAISSEIANLGDSFDQEQIIAKMENQSKRLLNKQETLNNNITSLTATLHKDDIIATVKSESRRLRKSQEAINGIVSGLNKSLAPTGVIDAVKSQMATFEDKISTISLQPIMTALQSQSEQLAASQNSALHAALSDIAVRGIDGDIAVDHILAAVKAESERVLAEQGTVIRSAVNGVVEQLNSSLNPANIISAIEDQSSRQLAKQDAISNEIANLGAAITLDDQIESLQEETIRLFAKQEQQINRALAGISLEPLLAEIKIFNRDLFEDQSGELHEALSDVVSDITSAISEESIADIFETKTAQLLAKQNQFMQEKLGGTSLEPILEAINNQSKQLAESQSRALHAALSDISVRGGDGEVAIDPIMVALKAESERVLAQQSSTIRDAIESMSGKLGKSFAADYDKVIKEVADNTAQLLTRQNELHDMVTTLGDSLSPENLAVAIESQTSAMLDKIPGFSLEPILDALNNQSEQLAQQQSMALQEALSTIAIRGSDGEVALDPILATLKAESERQLAHHGNVIRAALDGLVTSNDSSPNAMLEEVKAETSRLLEIQEASIKEAIAGISLEPILEAIKTQNIELANTQNSELQAALNSIVNDISRSLSVDGMVEVVHSGTEKILKQQRELIQAELAGQSVAPILEALQSQSEQMVSDQRKAISDALLNVAVRSSDGAIAIEPLLATVEAANERNVERQEMVIRRTMDEIIDGMSAIQSNTSMIAEQLTSSGQSEQTLLESVISEVRSESQRIIQSQEDTIQQLLQSVQHGSYDANSNFEQVIAAVQDELGRLTEVQESVVREAFANASLETASLISLEPLVSAVQTETAHLASILQQTLQDVVIGRDNSSANEMSLTPILDAIKEQGEHLADNQSRIMQDILMQISVSTPDNRPAMDSILESITSTVKAESERVLGQQSEIVREVLGGVVSGISELFATDTIIDTLKSEIRVLGQQMEEGLNSEAISLDAILATIKDQGVQLVEKQTQVLEEAMRMLPAGSSDNSTADMAAIIEAVKIEGELLLQRQSDMIHESVKLVTSEMLGSMSPDHMIDTVKSEILRLVETVEQHLQDSGAIDMAPIVAAIQDETALLSGNIDTLMQAVITEMNGRGETGGFGDAAMGPVLDEIRESGNRVLQRLEGSAISQQMMETMRIENDRLVERLGQQVTLTPIIEALQAQSEVMAAKQADTIRETISEIMPGANNPASLERIIESVRFEGASIVEQIAEKISLQPLMRSLEKYMEKTAVSQFETLHETMMEVATKYTDGPVNFAPVVATIRAENAKLAESISGLLSGAPIMEAIRSEVGQLAKEQSQQLAESLAKLVAENGGNLDSLPLQSIIEAQTQRLSQELGEKISWGPVLEAIREENARLIQSQSELLENVITKVGQQSDQQPDLQPIIAAIHDETLRLTQQMGGKIDVEPLLATIREESSRAMQEQATALKQVVAEIAHNLDHDLNVEPIISAIQMETKNLSNQLGNQSDLKPILEAVKADNQLLRQQIEHGGGLFNRIMDGVKEQGERLAAQIEAQAVTSTARNVASIVEEKFANQTVTLQNIIAQALNNLRQDLTPDKLLDVIKTETGRIATTLETTTPITMKEAIRPVAQSVSPEAIRNAVKSETSRLETLLNKNIKSTIAKSVAKAHKKAQATAPGSGKKAPPVKIKLERDLPDNRPSKAIQWQPVDKNSDRVADVDYQVPELSPNTGLQLLMTQLGTMTAKGIDGKSLLELMHSMNQYVKEQFGEQSEYLSSSIQALIDNLELGTPLFDPLIVELLREIGNRSNLIMTSFNPDVPSVVNLDKGFLKTAKELQKQVDELAASRSGGKVRRSQTLSSNLDPDNNRTEIFKQFLSGQKTKASSQTQTQQFQKTVSDPSPAATREPADQQTTAATGIPASQGAGEQPIVSSAPSPTLPAAKQPQPVTKELMWQLASFPTTPTEKAVPTATARPEADKPKAAAAATADKLPPVATAQPQNMPEAATQAATQTYKKSKRKVKIVLPASLAQKTAQSDPKSNFYQSYLSKRRQT